MSNNSGKNENGRSSEERRAAISVVRGGKARPISGQDGGNESGRDAGSFGQGVGNGSRPQREKQVRASKNVEQHHGHQGQYEVDAQNLADMWDPRKRAERQERQEQEAALEREQKEAASRKVKARAQLKSRLPNVLGSLSSEGIAPESERKAASQAKPQDDVGKAASGAMSQGAEHKAALDTKSLGGERTAKAEQVRQTSTASRGQLASDGVDLDVATQVTARPIDPYNSDAVSSAAEDNFMRIVEAGSVAELNGDLRKTFDSPGVAGEAVVNDLGVSQAVSHGSSAAQAVASDGSTMAQAAVSSGPGAGQAVASHGPDAAQDVAPHDSDAAQIVGPDGPNAAQGALSDEAPESSPSPDQSGDEKSQAQTRPSATTHRRKTTARSAKGEDENSAKKHSSYFAVKIVLVVVLAVVLILAGIFGYAALSRWTWSDDATDLQGTWHMSGETASVVITTDSIDLAGKATYGYTIDSQAKVINETLGNMKGSARYRFSGDRNSVAIFDDGSNDWWANAMTDLAWYKDCLIAQITGATPPSLLGGESGVILYRSSVIAASTASSTAGSTASSSADVSAGASANAGEDGNASTNANASASADAAIGANASAGAGASTDSAAAGTSDNASSGVSSANSAG